MATSILLLISSFSFFIFLQKIDGITLDLIHRDSEHSPSYNPSMDKFQRFRNAIDRSVSRKTSFAAMASVKSNSIGPDSFGTMVLSGGGEYLMKVNIGSPPREFLAIADTGSDLTWTQCLPCEQCYDQNSPIFDPSKSKSYRKVQCNAPLCQAAGSSSCGNGNVCNYQVSYGDQSYTIGDLATDTLTFISKSGSRASFPGFSFGCGHQNQGTFSGNSSGLVGLGGGSVSVIKQLRNSTNGKFSYCLTSLNSLNTSRITFGTEAEVKGNGVVSTPLVQKYPDTFYFLTLEGISVAHKGIRRHHHRHRSAAVEQGNIIIDSGTTLTYLPEAMYYELEASLIRAIRGKRINDPQKVLGLCYEKPSTGEFSAPPIVAHFSGGDLVLRDGTFIEVEEGVICLTFAPSGDLAIFGNLHQMNYLVGYDLVNGVVNFKPTDCSKCG